MTTSSTAKDTAFVATKISHLGRYLHIDGNQKITAGNGTYYTPQPNAFSLVHISDCPGSTSICRKLCYVHGLVKHARATHMLYQHNSVEIRNILANDEGDSWATEMGAWISDNCEGGFRWHVSGDVFSDQYAKFIRDVCLESPSVDHWIYTRSFEFIAPLVEAPNLVVNLSVDAECYSSGREAAEKYGLRMCYLTTDGFVPSLPEDSVIFPDYNLRGRGLEDPKSSPWWQGLEHRERKQVCPVDFFGKSETLRCGPCDKCLKPYQHNG